MSAPQLSIVIPAYNESRRLPETLQRLSMFCNDLKITWEVLVVVEKSVDGTLDLAKAAAARQANFRVIDPDCHRGKGFAVRRGILEARGQTVLFMDADLSVPLDEILAVLKYLEEQPETDIVVGSRKHAQSRILKHQSWLRERMGETFNWILRLVAGVRIKDTQCGFKAFRQPAAQAIFSRQQLDGFAFDVEVLLLAERLGFVSVELPVQWINSPLSHVRIVRDSLRMLCDAVRVRGLVRRKLCAPRGFISTQ